MRDLSEDYRCTRSAINRSCSTAAAVDDGNVQGCIVRSFGLLLLAPRPQRLCYRKYLEAKRLARVSSDARRALPHLQSLSLHLLPLAHDAPYGRTILSHNTTASGSGRTTAAVREDGHFIAATIWEWVKREKTSTRD